MPDYSKTIIYKISCKDLRITESYGGHTVNESKRRTNHKSACNNINSKSYNSYVYQFIRAHGGFDNWEMLWQYDFSCETKQQAFFEERKFIETNNCELNSDKPITTEDEKKEYNKEYRENNKKKIEEQNKEYYQDNKEIIKQYYQDNKEIKKQYYQDNKEIKKQYYQDNKDKIVAQQKQYEKKNKEKIAKRKKEYNKHKITCECGCEIIKGNLLRHLQTKKHQQLILKL
jgi:hypothetical protein